MIDYKQVGKHRIVRIKIGNLDEDCFTYIKVLMFGLRIHNISFLVLEYLESELVIILSLGFPISLHLV